MQPLRGRWRWLATSYMRLPHARNLLTLHRDCALPPCPAHPLLCCPAVELLRSTNWQERVAAMGGVLEAVQGMGDLGSRCYELVQCVAFLPGWGDKNFQVGGKLVVGMLSCLVGSQPQLLPRHCIGL